MKIINACMASVAFTVVSPAILAETRYSYDPADPKTYIADVPDGETNSVTDAAASVLNGGSVTNFIKKGAGALVSGKDITSYAGGIRIEDGIFRSVPGTAANNTVGRLSGGGDVWVLDGATMELYAPDIYSTHMTGKTTHIAGRGFGGKGALVVCAGTKNQAGATFGSKVVLEDDALVCNESNAQFHLAVNGSTLDFNFHTLHAGGVGEVGFYDQPTLSNMQNPGVAIVSEGYGVKFQRYQTGTWNLWHTYCDLVLTGSSRLIFDSYYGNSFNWPVKMRDGSGIHVKSTAAASWTSSTSYNTVTGNGVVHLLAPERNWIQFNQAKDFLQIKGRVTGGGLLLNTYTPGSSLYLANAANDFTNGIVAVNCSVNLMANGSLPAGGAALSLTNAYAVFHSSQTYSLPPLEAHGNCAVTNYPGASPSGAWRGCVVKTGTGTLEYNTLVGAPLLDVRGGTAKVNGVGAVLPVFDALGGTSSGTIDMGGRSYSVSGVSGAPRIANCPTLTVADEWTVDATAPSGSAGATTDGALEFAAGSAVVVENAEAVEDGKRGRTWTIAAAAGGISGMPSLSGGMRGWSLEKSADGKTLLLHSPKPGLSLIVF